MSISLGIQDEDAVRGSGLAGFGRLLKILMPRRRRSNRIDLHELPEALQRDLGVVDSRVPPTCRSAWRAAMLSYPPRGL